MKLIKIVLLCLGLLMMGCSENSEIVSEFSLEHRELLLQADNLQEAFAERRILSLSSNRDKIGFENSLKEARYALILLAQNPNDAFAVQLGYRAIKELELIVINRADQPIIDQFYRQLGSVISEAAARLGIDLGQLDWRLYSTNFSNTIAPWGVTSSSSNWDTGVSQDESYISVRGPSNKAWLLSPTFDLTGIANPSIRIVHQTRIDRNDRMGDAFNRVLINQETFRAFITTDYNEEDPNTIEWKPLDLGAMPSSVDFHTVESPKIDLSEWSGQKVTIAFVLDADPRVIGSHYITWQISTFELYGQGEMRPFIPRASALYEHSFTRSTLLPYKQLSLKEFGAQFEPFAFGANFRLAKIGTNGNETDTWFFSPVLDIGEQELLKLTIKETVLNPQYEKMEILISKDYTGGDPLAATWIPLERINPVMPDAGARANIVSGPFDMAPYLGQKVVLGFRFKAQASDNIVWDLETISLIGIGPRISTNVLNLTYEPDWMANRPDPIPVENLVSFFDFSVDFQGFTPQVIAGDPAEWMTNTRGDSTYVLISGHRPPKEGRTRFISPEFSLPAEGAFLQIKQALNFYGDQFHDRDLIRMQLHCQDQEIKIELNRRPMGVNWTVIESELYPVPEQCLDKTIRFSFEYASGNEVFPNWNIYWAKFFGIDEE
jgi:hypothetical protein